ncbi:MAG TPA: sugar transferase [Firmicutes bacterium]|nr:sugar transferase [Bacillota bacterium]
MALRSATGGRVVGGVEWDAGSAPAAFYAPKKKSAFSRGLYAFAKRAFDIVSSLVFLVAFSWLYLILALVVKLGDGGKVFYFHERVGKNGKTIRIPKFRTMKKNADKLADMLTPEQLEQYKREYKIDNDPRITKVGKFLRRTSLDELPQIWSIFIGQLSVVGPRPLMRDELSEKYGKDADKLLSVKPGLIGYWASHGRSNCTYESGERQKMELYYVDNRSAWMDTKIIFKTIAGVIRRDGAM